MFPLIFHIPHSATAITEEAGVGLLLDHVALGRELLRMTDRYTDELFDVPGLSAERIVFPVSRLVVDPERFLEDEMVEINRGLYMDEATGVRLPVFDELRYPTGRLPRRTGRMFPGPEEQRMIGAIAGDMVGAPYERVPIKRKDFAPRVAGFTDDTVLTVAVAHAILTGADMAETIKDFANRHPRAGYGGGFRRGMLTWESAPYNSFGNGSAMRVSPVGFAYDTEIDVLHHAARSAAVTHDHPEGIKGARATALAIFLARQGADKETIRSEIAARFGYDLDRTVDAIRPGYRFDVSCQGSVPESIVSFLDAADWLDAVKNAISLGGDADTMACIAGGIAQAYYRHVPADIVAAVRRKLPPDLLKVVDRFNETYGCQFSSRTHNG